MGGADIPINGIYWNIRTILRLSSEKSTGRDLSINREQCRKSGPGRLRERGTMFSLRRKSELFILPLSSDFEEFRKSMSAILSSGNLFVGTK